MPREPLTRAEFLKILAAGAGGIVFLRGSEDALAAITGVDDDLDEAALNGDAARAAALPYMTVVHGTPVDVNVKTAIAKLGGMGRFVRRGDVVVIKPNICTARAPEYAATTNPTWSPRSSAWRARQAPSRWASWTTHCRTRRRPTAPAASAPPRRQPAARCTS